VTLGTSTVGRSAWAPTVPSSASAAAPPTVADAEPAPLPTSERLAVYAYANESTEPDELEFLIQRAAALPASHRRTFELDALLMRLAELDPRRAVRFARTLRLETERLVPLFQSWAERDANAALAELRRFENLGAVREIALALLDVLGDDERGLERIETVLSPAQIPAFRQDAVVRLTARDPFRALRAALALGDTASRTRAVSRIASEWAERDPAAALAQVDTIADETLRRSYQTTVLSEWARIDPDAVFEHLRANRGGGETGELVSVLSSLAPADPDGVLELADALPREMRWVAQQFALTVIAERDPYAAIEKLDALPRDANREQLLSTIAQAFARRDPDGALEWAKSLQPPSQNALMSVLNGISTVDPERAVDLMLEGDLGMTRPTMLPLLLMSNAAAGRLDSARTAAIADRLVASNDINVVSQIGTLMSAWSRRDPQAALDWLLRNAERAGRHAVTQVASQLAADDPLTAAGVIDRLPSELQGDWLQSVAAGYAQSDAEAAAAWILQYEGRPGFAESLAVIAPALAQSDPRAAARLLDRVDGPLATFAVSQVAAAWAVSDPVAAADWAMQLGDATLRANALTGVVTNWANQDMDGARRWLLAQPRNDLRDQALRQLVQMTVMRDGDVDSQLFDAFSNDAMRQTAVMSAAAMLGGRDRDAARRLVDLYVTDPQLRQQAYAMMDRTGVNVSVAAPGIALTPSGIPIVPPNVSAVRQGFAVAPSNVVIR